MTELEIKIDSKRYGNGKPVFEDLEITISSGEVVALHGPSGAGKTTLLGILAGLDSDYTGEMLWQSRPMSEALPLLGVVFQEPRLLPWMTVRDNVSLGLTDRKTNKTWVDELLDAIGLLNRASALPHELSGGMQRRVALARAFAVRPELLLLDEPFVSLDMPTAKQLRELLQRLWQTLRPTVILVSHDLEDGITLADRMLFMSKSPARIIKEQTLPWPQGAATYSQRRLVVEKILETNPGLLSGYPALQSHSCNHLTTRRSGV